jgi:hypothetical protein
VKLFVEWELVERDLLRGGLAWEAVAVEVHRFADSYDDPAYEGLVERPSEDPLTVVLRTTGRILVTLRRDPLARALFVLAVEPEPDPNAEPDDDPGAYEPEPVEHDLPPDRE